MKFEEKLSELEKIVDKLEEGTLSLEDSLSLFEEGIKLSKSCQKILDEADKKVSVIVKDLDGNSAKQPFDESNVE